MSVLRVVAGMCVDVLSQWRAHVRQFIFERDIILITKECGAALVRQLAMCMYMCDVPSEAFVRKGIATVDGGLARSC